MFQNDCEYSSCRTTAICACGRLQKASCVHEVLILRLSYKLSHKLLPLYLLAANLACLVYVIKHCAKRLYVSCRIGKFRRILALEDADQEGFEDEGLYYHQRKRGDPKSRAQQQLRELEGKERLEKSRVERRLKLTQAAGQGTL